MPYYFSLQISSIQNSILRHDRLWSIAGVSHLLSWLNEIEMTQIVQSHNGKAIIFAGGKFTASFINKNDALAAISNIKKLISTTLPMLDFQHSEVIEADNLNEALFKQDGFGLIVQLSEAKRCFKGFGFTYNPQLQVCDECGEYPAERRWDEDERLCRICFESYEASDIKITEIIKESDQSLTSIERIYKGYLTQFTEEPFPQIPRNFENLFTDKQNTEKKMMAVWVSDINNMGDKVPLWFSEEDAKIPETLKKVSDFNIKLISKTLIDVFGKDTVSVEDGRKYIPFRLIIGGGDDLCIVMQERDIVRFALHFSKNIHTSLNEEISNDGNHPLNLQYLQTLIIDGKQTKHLKPHSFGGAFVVVPLHTPFKEIHQVAETLMKDAKQKTNRIDNSINWRVLSAAEETVSERLLPFDKPLFIESSINKDTLCFEDYYKMAKNYKGLSNSHRQQIIEVLFDILSEVKDEVEVGKRLETFLKRMLASSTKDDSLHNQLILDSRP
ncbi:MAG: hypothetical protein N2738_03285, partial [Thermodesulfovibrionales bacterium]|nr:hypothetical protein [Thermodesulfovibrionales bacterium]